MGLNLIVATAALAFSAFSAKESIQSRKDAAEANAAAAAENRKVNNEQRALNYASQAEERRNQIRQERVQRARILQAATNSGSGESSSEMGALGGMNTQLQANLGANAYKAQAADTISGYMQNAADFNTAAQQASMNAQNADALFNISSNIFAANGGFSAFKTKK